MMSSKKLMTAALVVFGLTMLAQTASAADPTGTWKWSVTFNNQTRERSVTLKLEGDKLTGTMPGRDGNVRTRDWEAKKAS